jgi:hypothetical protein
MSFSKGGQASKTTNNSNNSGGVDATTAGRMGQIWNAGTAAGNNGPGPLVTGASNYNTGVMNAGNLGLGAMSGDQDSISKMMNPYISNVIDANNKQWANTNQSTMNAVDARATAANAFGGARHGVTTGTALSQNNMNQMGQTAGLLNGGYNDMMQRAQAMASGGYDAAGANANLGFGGVGNPDLWKMMMMKQGFMGPTGQNSQTSGAQTTVGGGGSVGFSLPFVGGR